MTLPDDVIREIFSFLEEVTLDNLIKYIVPSIAGRYIEFIDINLNIYELNHIIYKENGLIYKEIVVKMISSAYMNMRLIYHTYTLRINDYYVKKGYDRNLIGNRLWIRNLNKKKLSYLSFKSYHLY